MLTEKKLFSARQKQRKKYYWLIFIFVILVFLLSFMLGRYPKPYFTPPSVLLTDDLALDLALNLRLPRILAAFIMGYGAFGNRNGFADGFS